MSLKILFLSHRFDPDVGGIESISEILAEKFSLAGHKVKVMTWTKELSVKTFPFTVIRDPGLYTLLREHSSADIVFENNPCLRLGWPAILFGRPTVIGLQTWITQQTGRTGFSEILKFKWLQRAQQVIACSEAIRKRCWPKSTLIGNPYQEAIFKVDNDIQKTMDFVFLGRLVSDKGVDIAIKAMHRLLTITVRDLKTANFSLSIVGDGPERTRLEEMVKELDLYEHVKFYGILRGEKLVTFLNQHRYIIVPSVWEEPFGIVALEGMACGCLPIVSDCGGLPDAIGKAGLQFPKGDVNALAECMERVTKDAELEKQLRLEANKHLTTHHPESVANKYLEVIES